MWRAAFLTALLVVAFSLSAGACGDDNDEQAQTSPSVVEVSIDEAGLHLPASLQPGYTTFRVVAAGEMDNALTLARLKDGVARDDFEKVLTANEEDSAPYAVIVGGSGSTLPGNASQFTVELVAGDYAAATYDEEGELLAYGFVTVSGDRIPSEAPAVEGEIDVGPGMVFSLPSAFDGRGTFKVVNKDSTTHMAQLIRLEGETQPEDVAAWAEDFMQGEMPTIAPAGGLGTFDAGQAAWISLDLDPGTYMFVCFIGDEHGLHMANGMWTAFTVN